MRWRKDQGCTLFLWSNFPSLSFIEFSKAGYGYCTYGIHLACRGKRSRGRRVCYNVRMEKRLKELMERVEDWPPAAQEEAIASLEAIAGYVNLYDPSHDDR